MHGTKACQLDTARDVEGNNESNSATRVFFGAKEHTALRPKRVRLRDRRRIPRIACREPCALFARRVARMDHPQMLRDTNRKALSSRRFFFVHDLPTSAAIVNVGNYSPRPR